jgi:hypothetical protein
MTSNDHPFDVVVQRLTAKGRVRMRSRNSARAHCPAHTDKKPSLSITRKVDRVLMKCFGGCSFGKIVRALGMHQHETFVNPRSDNKPKPKIIATYEYWDEQGTLIARKCRFEPKGFCWQSPDSSGGWKPGRDGKVGLYRLLDIQNEAQVLITEGEKAADFLHSLGFAATCPPSGLWMAGCHEVVVLPDADKVGRAHALRVATACSQLQMHTKPFDQKTDGPVDEAWPRGVPGDPDLDRFTVKIVDLPELFNGDDVFDWFKAGHNDRDLKLAIAAAPVWTPESVKEAKATRKRELGKQRARQFRARQRQWKQLEPAA